MKKTTLFMLRVVMSFSTLSSFHVDNVSHKKIVSAPSATLPVQNFFSDAQPSFQHSSVITNPLDLQQAAKDALRYFSLHAGDRKHIVDPAGFKNLMSFQRTKQTLQFIVDTIEQDRKTGTFRIQNPAFLEENFGCMQWQADTQGAASHNVNIAQNGNIRLTTYGILVVRGNRRKTADFPCGLYQLHDDALRRQFTKHQVLAGVLEKPENKTKRTALAWVCRQDLEDALMQGTVIVKFADGTCKMLNVDKHNGVAYDRKQKNVLAQKRYWFFRQLHAQAHKQTIDRFKHRKNVVFAGDLYHIGLGKVIALTYQNPVTGRPELRLGILADTGGAFVNNLYQLDLFGGIFETRDELKRHLRFMPTSTSACVLYKK